MIKRYLNLRRLLKISSYFLFGPRATGKSTLIKHHLSQPGFNKTASYINLLDSKLYLRLKSDPSLLSSIALRKYVIIDEIQKIPLLLNEVHRLIEDQNKKFLLTGSSSRKLKFRNTNLLAGRALSAKFFPLTWFELYSAGQFKLQHYLQFGGLPIANLKKYSVDYLHSYVETYIKEEIQSEALVRSLPNYIRFLQSAALNNAQLLNYTKTARDAQLSPNTVHDYYQILEDTLLGFQVAPWFKSKKRKAIQTSKFYFFDTGVTNSLKGVQNLDPKSNLFGQAFEQFIGCELRAYLSYKNIHLPLQFWQSKSRMEVDFVIGDQIAIEVKASNKITSYDQKGLLAIKEEKKWKHLIIVSQDPIEGHFKNSIQHIYWENFLKQLWNNHFFSHRS